MVDYQWSSDKDIFAARDMEYVPAVLDWALNGTCNMIKSFCGANAHCLYNNNTSWNPKCFCDNGYEVPYLPSGCQVNPVQPTLATEDMGAGSFTLNISRVNGSVTIATGIVQARVTQTVFDENPVAIFEISKVLLPKEIFGKNPNNGKDGSESAQPPIAVASAPEFNGPSVDLPAPTGFREEIKSGAGKCGVWRPFLAFCCIGLYLLL
ncbi:hypothetical protein RHMOL_Rhmol02G0208100 [Rhododendron molle]|uniref:Uncharacterized protein n=1 Tax=Rhododendron molle TaxID=49168 RepID=A0ACC0PTR0_RHOML|nr:hypothetical protein RHMOL_Rhmol02G0208100 [Rhododendron molle]